MFDILFCKKYGWLGVRSRSGQGGGTRVVETKHRALRSLRQCTKMRAEKRVMNSAPSRARVATRRSTSMWQSRSSARGDPPARRSTMRGMSSVA